MLPSRGLNFTPGPNSLPFRPGLEPLATPREHDWVAAWGGLTRPRRPGPVQYKGGDTILSRMSFICLLAFLSARLSVPCARTSLFAIPLRDHDALDGPALAVVPLLTPAPSRSPAASPKSVRLVRCYSSHCCMSSHMPSRLHTVADASHKPSMSWAPVWMSMLLFRRLALQQQHARSRLT